MQTRLETPQDIRHRLWAELGRATQDRHHAWRTPVLATIGEGGTANARTVVLRSADANLAQLCFYTDARSPKAAELVGQPNALLVFWSQRLSWQLRVRVDMTVHTTGPQVDAVWQRVKQSAAAGDYLNALAPGEALSCEQAAPAGSAPAHHLALLSAQVLDMDWLELARGGHRRARLGTDTWEWLTP